MKRFKASNVLEYSTNDIIFRIKDYVHNKKISGDIELFIIDDIGTICTQIPLEFFKTVIEDIEKINKEIGEEK